MAVDPHRYRVTLICACANDAAEGYGPTPEDARATAYAYFRKGGHRGKARDEILEVAVEHGGGGSHYEEFVS